MSEQQQRPIADYALIGDTRTAALISSHGSIDWMCMPAFDGEPVFGRLIAGPDSGCFSITIDGVQESHRSYRERSAIVDTAVRSATGAGRLTDAMVMDVKGALLPQLVLIRTVRCDEGTLHARVLFDPRRGLPGVPPRAGKRAGTLVCDWGSLAIGLQSFPELDLQVGREAVTEIKAGSSVWVVMTLADRSPVVSVPSERVDALVDATARWWREWVAETDYEGPYEEQVLRSLITLQLLTFAPSGAPVAAPTTSLPEVIGGERNWDYRYSWPRDASIGLAAFLGLGKPDLAHSYMHWLLHASRLTRPRLQVLYTLFGKTQGKEEEVAGVPGYRGSLPVRVGNAASTQHQLDVYGWVVEAGWLLTKAGRDLHAETWRALAGFADFAADHWHEPDAGIWEVRGSTEHFVHSKLMAWLCLDRALKIAERRRTRASRKTRWAKQRELLAGEIRAHGFDDGRGAYVRSFGSKVHDAALLILPVLGFDEDLARVEGTIAAIRRDLDAGGGLLYRYRRLEDGVSGTEGAFLPCSFWLVQALARTGRREEALRLFGDLLELSNDVGLFAEEIDPATKEHLGNFPQAFTHATLVQAALSLGKDDN